MLRLQSVKVYKTLRNRFDMQKMIMKRNGSQVAAQFQFDVGASTWVAQAMPQGYNNQTKYADLLHLIK